MVVIFTPLRGLFFVGNVMTKRELELLYNRTAGKERTLAYLEWRKIVSELPLVTAPERFSAPKTENRC